jgi:hypothetical protein
VLLNTGTGCTRTTTLSPALLQLLALVVITYVTSMKFDDVLVNNSLIGPLPLPAVLPLIFGNAARVQVKPAPAVALVGV